MSNGLGLLLCWILGEDEGAGGLKCLGLEGVGAKKGVGEWWGGGGEKGRGRGRVVVDGCMSVEISLLLIHVMHVRLRGGCSERTSPRFGVMFDTISVKVR